ncbi:Shedu immune nuclease family protein [Kribbella jiaozuonensis]|uniref:Shedu immune nuclease family protein n=1 Tax=Kribbella jiaozuonensis TaxID=2575441 RepID=UPI00192D9572|nr:Shedu immune nuclease family protein [Kribbella jiaozuonensis]
MANAVTLGDGGHADLGGQWTAHPPNHDRRGGVLIDFSSLYSDGEFDVENGDFSQLAIRDSGNNTGFHYFYDEESHSLVRDFLLQDGPQVATLCQVKLIKKGDTYTPRIRLWKKDKTRPGRKILEEEVQATNETKRVKANVDTDGCHENFWKVIRFLESFSGVVLPEDEFRVIHGDSLSLARSLEGEDKATIVEAVRTAIGGSLTEEDIAVLANRKGALEVFKQLLFDEGYTEQYRNEHSIRSIGEEGIWQHFFEANQWIFGYGLSLISSESFSDQKLEQITTGANIFGGAGKRSDAVLRSKGYISSLMFAEIKTPAAALLYNEAYRPPDVFRPSKELSGGVAQLQKTAEKAVRGIGDQLRRAYDSDGTPLGFEVSTVKPKQILIIGKLDEFVVNGDINPEKSMSFELYRRSMIDIEIITFDELFERARFIVGDDSKPST